MYSVVHFSLHAGSFLACALWFNAITDAIIFFNFTIALLMQSLESSIPIETSCSYFLHELGKQFLGVPSLVVWAS
jgi:hypothetical protein